MNTRITASGSQKTGATVSGKTRDSTPFDQITKLEKEEQLRVQKELDAMEREQEEVEKAVAEKTIKAEEELKKNASEELKQYKEQQLTKILNEATKEAEKCTNELEAAYDQHGNKAAAYLVSTMKHADSFLFS